MQTEVDHRQCDQHPDAQGDEQRDGMTFLFEITGQVTYPNGERHPIRFSTSVDPSSNVEIT